MNTEKVKCSQCKVSLPREHFGEKRGGDLYKQCINCREMKRKSARKKCDHGRQRSQCKDCGGSQICEHNRRRSTCKDCGGSSICEHDRVRSQCKDCEGSGICEHNRVRSKCKDCGGGSICEHDRQRYTCKDCEGSGICEHNRERSKCKDCEGGSICEHDRVRSTCKDCEGGSICEHDRVRSTCKDCEGGSICEHARQRSKCKDCGGGSICEHDRVRSKCKICDPNGHLANLVRSRVRDALKSDKSKHSIEYLGTNIETYRRHIEDQFEEGMSWDNYGKWEIDHIVPIKYPDNGQVPTLEEVIERLHYLNTQPLWKPDNASKGNRRIGK